MRKHFFDIKREAAKESYLFNGSTIKRGGGDKWLAKKNFFWDYIFNSLK